MGPTRITVAKLAARNRRARFPAPQCHRLAPTDPAGQHRRRAGARPVTPPLSVPAGASTIGILPDVDESHWPAAGMPPGERRRSDSVTREELVGRLRRRLMHHGAPELQLLFIVCLSGTVAFLVSASGLWLGLSSMTVRYTFAAVSGYLTFLVLIRVWIAWQRGRWEPEVDIDPEVLSIDLPHDGSPTEVQLFAGGRSGGAGASGQWTAGSPDGATQQPGMGGHLDVDLDELWPIAVAAICAIRRTHSGRLRRVFRVSFSLC